MAQILQNRVPQQSRLPSRSNSRHPPTDHNLTAEVPTSRNLTVTAMSAPQAVTLPSDLAALERRFVPRLNALGFRFGASGGLLSRTMMLAELKLILGGTRESASLAEISEVVLTDNLLGKPTSASRRKSLDHLVELYGLDSSKALFRVFRRLATMEPDSVPILALVCVFCRDAQLRASFCVIRSLKLGEQLHREHVERFMSACFPQRFSPAMLMSLAQNTSASWTAAGHLSGRIKKTRTHPAPRPLAVAFALLAGYLVGLRGQSLLQSEFGALASAQASVIPSQLALASARGLLGFKYSGGVVEFDFSPLLTPTELAFTDVAD